MERNAAISHGNTDELQAWLRNGTSTQPLTLTKQAGARCWIPDPTSIKALNFTSLDNLFYQIVQCSLLSLIQHKALERHGPSWTANINIPTTTDPRTLADLLLKQWDVIMGPPEEGCERRFEPAYKSLRWLITQIAPTTRGPTSNPLMGPAAGKNQKITYQKCAEGFAKFILKISNSSRIEKEPGIEFANFLGQLEPKFNSISSQDILVIFQGLAKLTVNLYDLVMNKRKQASQTLNVEQVQKINTLQSVLLKSRQRVLAIQVALKENNPELARIRDVSTLVHNVCLDLQKCCKEQSLTGSCDELPLFELSIAVINRPKLQFDNVLVEFCTELDRMCGSFQ